MIGHLRKVEQSDLHMLLDWRNDPITRANSNNVERVEVAEHMLFMKKAMDSDHITILVYEEIGIPVGTVRLEKVTKSSKTMALSWTVAPSSRGCGIGGRMLKLCLEQFESVLKDHIVIAEIKEWNEPSKKIAINNGFEFSWKEGKTELYKWNPNSDLYLIDEIEKVRGKNNVNWMDILRIAFKYAPEETRKVFKKITDSDDEIGRLSRKLAENGKES
jgi:RimJ/RimL family protein N-acetyltransferase